MKPAEDEQFKRIKNLRSFQNYVGKLKKEHHEKLSTIKNQMIMEREDQFNIFEPIRDQAFSSPFGLNDSFQMKNNPGPGITPTQISKSAKDQSRSFEEVPSFFGAQNKSQKSDIPKENKELSNNQKAETHKSFAFNGNISFEEAKDGNQNILEDSFGVKHGQDKMEGKSGNFLDDSFGFKAELQGSEEIVNQMPSFGEVPDENENFFENQDSILKNGPSFEGDPISRGVSSLSDEGIREVTKVIQYMRPQNPTSIK